MRKLFKRTRAWATQHPTQAASYVNLASDGLLFFLRDTPSVEAAAIFWGTEITQRFVGDTPLGYSLVNAGFAVGMGFLRHSSGVAGNTVTDYTLPVLMGVFGVGFLYYPLLKGGEYLQRKGPELARQFRRRAAETTSRCVRFSSAFVASGLENGGNRLCKGLSWLKPIIGVTAIVTHVFSISALTWQGLHGHPKELITAAAKSGWIAGDTLYNEVWRHAEPVCSAAKRSVKERFSMTILKLN